MPESTDALASAYDAVPYPGRAQAQTQPDRMATIATLFGLAPAAVGACRVLELGCGDGANLLPVALGAPGSTCVGVDLAAGPVAKGTATAEALGLRNLSLRRMDVADVGPDFGQFDYVIAHGLYSWVPPPVRESILRVCRQNLAPQGVALVSYNAHPGCRVRMMVREMMRYHVARFDNPRERVDQAKALLKFLSDPREEADPWGRVLRSELETVGPRDPGALFHDDLAEVNEPFYFREFAAAAASHALQYLAEADLADTQYATPDAIPGAGPGRPKEAAAMRAISAGLPPGDLVAREQYADFLRGRRFRQTLLCHADVRVERPPSPQRVTALYASGQLRPASTSPDVRGAGAEQFLTGKGRSATTNQPLLKAALLELSVRWPRPVHFDELLAAARERSGNGGGPAADEAHRSALAALLLGGFAGGLLELHAHVPPFVTEPGERPAASPLARLEAAHGDVVTNVMSGRVRLEDPMARGLFRLLDGTRDRAALARELAARVARGEGVMEHNGRRVTDEAEAAGLIRAALDERLRTLGRLALLVA